jgi:propanol-preferring alcohol dehydrogenase
VVSSVCAWTKDECGADSTTRLDFTARGLVHPILTKGTLGDVDKFCEMMIHGKLPGRAVLKVSA